VSVLSERFQLDMNVTSTYDSDKSQVRSNVSPLSRGGRDNTSSTSEM